MAGVLSSPTPSLPTSSAPFETPPLLASPVLVAEDALRSTSPDSQSTATTSEPSTPTGGHSGLVPAYPYNVTMVPAAVNGGPLPDDSEVTTRLPSICVDYLSHDWAEDDVWTSWKAMTRHKAEIANGVRLENASWRTWAKQRGNLKTVSPETLNWLKDSDVTWLYGPLHTAVEAVPPPRESTTSERLGLEPLRSLSDAKKSPKKEGKETKPAPSPSKRETATKGVSLLQRRHSTKPELKTKPILKYRSLSDILMPQSSPTSPMIEQLGMDFEDQATISVHHARSDSHLVRLNSLNRKPSKRSSPLGSPGSSSPERTASDSSSAAGTFLRKTQKKKERRHISFNHRVEQCIAIDSADERQYSSQQASSSSDEDDDDVLTFGARSPRHTSFMRQPPKPEPHTIARLGPTTLKSVELYPAPSPAVVFSSDPSEYDDDVAGSPPDNSFGEHVEEYSSGSGGRRAADPQVQAQQQRAAAAAVAYAYQQDQPSRSTWDPEDDDDYAMGGGFDYFGGGASGDVGMGDEYDMAQYGSTHLIGGTHNNYGVASGSESSSYIGGGPYDPSSPYNPNTNALEPSAHATASASVPHYRDSTSPSSSSASPADSSSTSPAASGPHAPTLSRDAAAPKRSAMKGGRTRESSADSTTSSGAGSPSLSASPSPPTGINAIATAIPPHVRPGIRRNDSSEDKGGFQERGRSASRGSSSSLEREASANRRSSSSISPSSAYSPPIGAGGTGFPFGASGTHGSPGSIINAPPSPSAGASSAAAAAKPIAIQPRGMGGAGSASYDSLEGVMSGAAASRGSGFLPDVPEGGERSGGGPPGLGKLITSSSVDSMGSLGSFGAGQTPTSPTSAGLPSPARSRFSVQLDDEDEDDAMVEDVGSAYPSAATKDTSQERKPPLSPTPAVAASSASPSAPSPSSTAPSPNPQSALGHSRTPSAPRLRNPSPSLGTSASDEGHGAPASPALQRTAAVPSPPIANGGAIGADEVELKRTDSSSSANANGTASSAGSYARRSLLRAARASSDSGSSRGSTSRERPSMGEDRRSASASSAPDHEYAFGADENVGKGIDVAGTARDLLGAIGKGIWGSLGGGGSGMGRRESSNGR
ncbi:hypothetical protein JCM10213_006824 [Rhodosporidiobolus nylandii]